MFKYELTGVQSIASLGYEGRIPCSFILGKLFIIAEIQFLHLEIEDNNNSSFTRL